MALLNIQLVGYLKSTHYSRRGTSPVLFRSYGLDVTRTKGAGGSQGVTPLKQ